MEVKRVKAKVVMLPVNEEGKKGDIILNGKNLFIVGERFYNSYNGCFKKQHLYFTTDEEIKVGDWCYDEELNIIVHCNTNILVSKHIIKGSSKIIATTDKSLVAENDMDIHTIPTQYVEEDTHLPQPSKAFIKKYVEADGIDEVMIDYEYLEKIGNILIAKHHVNSIDSLECDYVLKPKINSYNEITIHPIKDSWNKEEVEELCRDAYTTGYSTCACHETNQGEDISEDKWIKENL